MKPRFLLASRVLAIALLLPVTAVFGQGPASFGERCVRELCAGYRPDPRNALAVSMWSQPGVDRDAQFEAVETQSARAARAAIAAQAAKDREFLRIVDRGAMLTNRRALAVFHVVSAWRHIWKIAIRPDKTLDREATRAALRGLPGADPAVVIALAERYLRWQASAPRILLADQVELAAWPAPEARRETLALLDSVERVEANVARRFGVPRQLLFANPSRRAEIRRRVQSGAVDAELLRDLGKDRLTAQMLGLAMDDAFLRSVPFKPVDPRGDASAAQIAAIRARMAEHEASSADLEAQNPTAERALEAVSSCAMAAAQNKAFLPTREQVAAFVVRERNVLRPRYAERVRPFLSRESWRKLEGEIQGWNLRLLQSREEQMASFVERLRARADASAETASLMTHLNASGAQLMLGLFLGASPDESMDLEDLNDICTDEALTPLDESFALLNRRSLFMAPSLVTAPDEQEFVAFHEYSHLLGEAIRAGEGIGAPTRDWYARTRSCLAGLRAPGEASEEEDWADNLAGATATEPIQFVCDRFERYGDAMITLAGTDLTGHANPFFRLLLIHASARGSLPNSCRDALMAKGQDLRLQNCARASALPDWREAGAGSP